MRRSVLTRRRVATADVTALRAAPQVEPPTAAGEAFDATLAARRNGRVYSCVLHALQAYSRPDSVHHRRWSAVHVQIPIARSSVLLIARTAEVHSCHNAPAHGWSGPRR